MPWHVTPSPAYWATESTAQEAVDLVRSDPRQFALVVTDYNMPGMSGLLLAQALLQIAPQLPVVISSGYVTEELQQRARQAGVRAVLFKEHTFERLVGLVHGLLETAGDH